MQVSVFIGTSVDGFTLPRDIRLQYVVTQHYPSGLVKTEYRVVS